MHGKRLLFAGCTAALLTLTASCESVDKHSNVTRTYEVKDLVVAKKAGTKPYMPMYALLVSIVDATGLSQLPKGTYTVRPEARGVILVKAPAAIQKQIVTVLADIRTFIETNKN
ncbi:MAG: hypothetical protein ACI89X_003406 [Planctomycetota bacterium]|jgi:hypothetical protein